LDKLIEEIIRFGKPIIVGSDITHPPKFVKKFATDTKSIIVSPSSPSNFEKKKKIAYYFIKEMQIKLRDKHQIAALYAAILAYKNFKSLFNKIDRRLEKQNKKHLSSEIKLTVLAQNTPISESIKLAESTF